MDRSDAENKASDAAGLATEAVTSFAADAKGRIDEIARGAQEDLCPGARSRLGCSSGRQRVRPAAAAGCASSCGDPGMHAGPFAGAALSGPDYGMSALVNARCPGLRFRR